MDTSHLLDLLTDTTRLHSIYVDRALARYGIHGGQGSLISALDILGPCSQKELADFRRVSPATTSVMLRRMEEKGLVLRLPAEEGGKRNQISLTEKGQEVAAHLRENFPLEAERILENLSEEDLEHAQRIFQTICANLAAHNAKTEKKAKIY